MNTIELFIKTDLEANGLAEKTAKSYANKLRLFEAWIQSVDTTLEGYSRSDVQDYINSLTKVKKMKATSVNAHFAAIKRFSQWANRPECVHRIRVVAVSNPFNVAPKALDKKDVYRIRREIDRSGNKRNMALFAVLFYCGLRVEEAHSLDISDIAASERKGHLTVRSGKRNAERTLPLNPEARKALLDYIDSRDDDNPALFLSNQKKRWSIRGIQKLCNELGFNPHAARHTLVTSLVDQKIDDETIRQITGHRSIQMVSRYRSVTEEQKEQALEGLYLD